MALSTGLINIQWITIRETNCTIHWIEIWGQMCNDEGDKVNGFTSPPNDATIWIACVEGGGKGERLKKGKKATALKSRFFFSNALPLSLAKAPAGYPNKISNNRKIESAQWTLSFPFSSASIQHKETSAEPLRRRETLTNSLVIRLCITAACEAAILTAGVPSLLFPISLHFSLPPYYVGYHLPVTGKGFNHS